MSSSATNSLPGIGTGRARPLSSLSPSSLRWNSTPVSLPSSDLTASGRHQGLQADAFLQRRLDLLGVGGHFAAGAPVEDGHVGDALLAHGHPGRVQGAVAAADDARPGPWPVPCAAG